MTFLYKDVAFTNREFLLSDISSIFGIGNQKGSFLLSFLGLAQNISTRFLNFYYFEVLSTLMKFFYITEDRLRVAIKLRINEFNKLYIRRGMRFFKNLPVRGQRTHTNAHQRKYLKLCDEI